MHKITLALVVLLILGFHVAPRKRGFLGVRGAAAESALRIAEVVPESPAEKAGLKAGELIVKIDGEAVTTVQDYVKSIQAHRAGDEVRLTLSEKGTERE